MMRIAMWSGPRNLSTAMMYSFAARPDFAVWDEPFYAAFLAATGIDHPMREAILEAGVTNPQDVSSACLDTIPGGKPHYYMKHMAHHMTDGMPLDWAKACVNIHLIRHPARVVASYLEKREEPTAEDIGFARQRELYEHLGGVIIDSHDIRADPERALSALCEAIDLPFDPAMLRWNAGGIAEDGVWAAHWYNAIHKSTGFAGPEGPLPQIDHPLIAASQPHYEALKAQKLTV